MHGGAANLTPTTFTQEENAMETDVVVGRRLRRRVWQVTW
jgi:hypothetical protein